MALHTSLSEDKQPALQQKKIIKILGKVHKASVLCKHQPCRVQINASFLVDLRFVPLKDLQADDNGSYEHIGSQAKTFQLSFKSSVLKDCNRISRKKVMGTNHFFLTRKYHNCASSPDLKRTISYCTTPGGDILGTIALIQYNFAKQEHAFRVKSHGNAKKNKVPYTRTQDSTKTLLRSNLAKVTPKEACQKTTRDLGGTLNAMSAGFMPRNRTSWGVS